MRTIAEYPPERAAAITGLSRDIIATTALRFGGARRALTLCSMGVDQSHRGTDKNTAILNASLDWELLGRTDATLAFYMAVTQNAGAGVLVIASTITIGASTGDTISANGPSGDGNQGGVFAFLGSSVTIRNSQIVQNTGRGVWLQGRSMGTISGGAIQNNTGFGIFLEFGAGLTLFGSPATITGNGGVDLQCSDAEASYVGFPPANLSGIGSISGSCTGF